MPSCPAAPFRASCRPSGRAILTPELCADAVDFALENTDIWTNTGGFQRAQSPYMTFGMDANFMNGRNATEVFATQLFGLPYSPICEDLPRPFP